MDKLAELDMNIKIVVEALNVAGEFSNIKNQQQRVLRANTF